MPQPGKQWYHVIFNTKGSWLHGDPRGFRSREHRIHSSGDYHNPPPAGEHQGLHKYQKRRSSSEVRLAAVLRPVIGTRCLHFLQSRDHAVLAAAVGDTHVHMLAELTEVYEDAKALIGQLKNIVSYEVRDVLPGSIWSSGCTLKLIKSRAHHENSFVYVSSKQEEGAWTWTFRDVSQ